MAQPSFEQDPSGRFIPDQVLHRPLADGLVEVRALLGDMADTVLTTGKVVTRLAQTDFQSPTFRNAAYNAMPERYGTSDRSLITITFDAGEQTFLVTGRVFSGNPYEVGHAAMGGMDLRRTQTVVYEYDGKGRITERVHNRPDNIYENEDGNPEVLLRHVVSRLGVPVGRTEFDLPQNH